MTFGRERTRVELLEWLPACCPCRGAVCLTDVSLCYTCVVLFLLMFFNSLHKIVLKSKAALKPFSSVQ